MRAVESAVGVQIPENARIIRNLLMGAQFQHDHIVHFYHLHALDWVDIVSALKADPAKTATLAESVSDAKVGGTDYYRQVQQRLQTFVDSGQLGPFTNAYWGHPAYQAAAGSQPHGRGPLHRGAEAAGPHRPDARHLRRQRTRTCNRWASVASPA